MAPLIQLHTNRSSIAVKHVIVGVIICGQSKMPSSPSANGNLSCFMSLRDSNWCESLLDLFVRVRVCSPIICHTARFIVRPSSPFIFYCKQHAFISGALSKQHCTAYVRIICGCLIFAYIHNWLWWIVLSVADLRLQWWPSRLAGPVIVNELFRTSY